MGCADIISGGYLFQPYTTLLEKNTSVGYLMIQLLIINVNVVTNKNKKFYNYRQANVSSVYRRIKTETPESDLKASAEQTLADKNEQLNSDDLCKPGPSTNKDKTVPKFLDPVKLIQKEKQQKEITIEVKPESSKSDEVETVENIAVHNKNPVTKSCKSVAHEPPQPLMTQELLERRLKIEDEVTFVSDVLL